MAGSQPDLDVGICEDNKPPDGAPYVCVVTIWDQWRLDPAACARAGVAHFSASLEPSILDDVRARRAILVLDLTNEGPEFDRYYFDLIHAFVSSSRLPAGRVIWLAQNRAIEADYNATYGAQAPLVKFAYFDFYIRIFAHWFASAEWCRDQIGDPDQHARAMLDKSKKDRYALCLNATPRLHRILAISALRHYGLFAESLVSFGGINYVKGPLSPEAILAQVAASPDYGYLLNDCDITIKAGELKVDAFTEQGNLLWNKIDSQSYYRTYFSLVTETDFSNGRIDQITEKLVKAFCLGHPCLVLGNPGSVRFMTDLGFSDFSPLLNHVYDQTLSSPARFSEVFKEVSHQFRMIRSDPEGWLSRVAPVSSFNIEHARSGGFLRAYQERHDRQLILFLKSALLGSG